jgi:hypothetical protein
LAVIAYGRWGGKELGYASDLDLIFLMPDEAATHRDQLTRVAQRLQSWLTTLTSAGRAYEIDVRLRPDGQAGLLLSTVSSFATYQREKAWTWEHQALTRARFAAGDSGVGDAFETIRDAIIALPREWLALRGEILDMRKRVAREHPNKDAATHFDLKHDSGGLVDMEFAVQALVLRYGATYPTMRIDHGNIALAMRAGELGLLESAATNALSVGDIDSLGGVGEMGGIPGVSNFGNVGDVGDVGGADKVDNAGSANSAAFSQGKLIAGTAADAYRALRARQHMIRLQATHDDVRALMPLADAAALREPIRRFFERVFDAL